LLRAADLFFAYAGRSPVLRGVSMEVPDGGFVGILGPNGSGKTTLLRALAGVIRPARGSVRLDGQDFTSIPRQTLARRMAVVPQETHLAFDYTVLEVVMMGRYPHLGTFEIEGPEDFGIAREALAATGTADLEDRPFDSLSGGEKQRVIVAAALAQITAAEGNGILLLDEPTVALDLAYQLEIRSILLQLNQQRRVTVVVSTHDLNLAAGLCRHLILLDRGRVLAAGPAEDMLKPALIQQLYGVDVDISVHARTGRLTVVPLARTGQPLQP